MRVVTVVFVAAYGEVHVKEYVDHRGDCKTAANGEVAKAVATVHAAGAVFLVPELVAPAVQRDFKALEQNDAGAHLEAGL